MLTMMKYAMTGVANTLVDYAVFALLNVVFGVHYLIAQTISYACGTANSYLLNRSWTFKRTGKAVKGELLRFVGVNVLMYGLSTGILTLLHSSWGWNTLLAKAISIIFATGAGFAANKYWVFGAGASETDMTKVSQSAEPQTEKP